MDDSVDTLGTTDSQGASTTVIKKFHPVLFVGLGGTGLEVLLRIRRRILHAGWGPGGMVRVDSLEEFPVAEFIHFDLDQGAILEGGKPVDDDPLADLVRLSPQDRLVDSFDIMKYLRTEEDLSKYPHVASWCPLTGDQVKGMDLSKGAGQIRGISRMYFYDSYSKIRDVVRQKLDKLKANFSKKAQLERLGIEVENEKVQVVIVGSCAGGTGSGSFLDFGWLARLLAGKSFGPSSYEVQLVLFTPRGFEHANANSVKANGYAAMMELETCMNDHRDYVGMWDPLEGKPILDPRPFTDVYIVESANLGRFALDKVDNVYEMVADVLFEDFSSMEFANKKRSIGVNQMKFKMLPYRPVLAAEYSQMNLSYHMGYSSFGQSILDTKYTQQKDGDEYRLAAAMLEAFFGIASADKSALQATDKQRDEFLLNHLKLMPFSFTQFPLLSAKADTQGLCAPFIDNQLTNDLLYDEHGGVEEAIQQKINILVERIVSDESSIKDWPRLLREMIPILEQDAIRNQDTTTNTSESRIIRRGAGLRDEKFEIIREKFYEYLDNREFGGLEFVLSLAELLKTSFVNPGTGLARQLEDNAKRYLKVREALRTNQVEETLNNIAGAVKGSLLSGPDAKKAKSYIENLKQDLGDYLRFHTRSVAATTAAALLSEIAILIGGRSGTDARGDAIYSGLLEQFHAGRRDVLAVSREISFAVKTIEDGQAKRHSNYLFLETDAVEQEMPPMKVLRDWANEAFRDFEGSRKIFPMLKTPDGKAKLLNKLRMRAASARAAMQPPSSIKKQDPLVVKLLSMDASQRMRKFSELLRAAMPWIDAEFTDVGIIHEQYKCYLGVMDPREWDSLLPELIASLPTTIGLTALEFALSPTGNPGRAVCYCELSGFPLKVLSGLSEWRLKYRLEGKRFPLHTHRDPTQFVQPMVPTPPELRQSAEECRLFQLAVMLRKLRRHDKPTIPPGLYMFDFGRGDWKSLGNERGFRNLGLPVEYQRFVEDAVNEVLAELDPLQLYALSELALFQQKETYAPVLSRTAEGKDVDIQGFTNGVLGKLNVELAEMAQARGLDDGQARTFRKFFADWGEGWADVVHSFGPWTELVPDSSRDPIVWEVAQAKPGGSDRCKRRVHKSFFEPGWLQRLCEEKEGIIPPKVTKTQTEPAPPPPPPPPPPLASRWYVGINQQVCGPYDFPTLRGMVGTGQLTSMSMVFKAGTSSWLVAGQVEELACIFEVIPPLPPMPS